MGISMTCTPRLISLHDKEDEMGGALGTHGGQESMLMVSLINL